MRPRFEELAHGESAMGTLTLRRRRVPLLDDEEIYEVVLNEEFLMSSLFHVAEEELARLGLGALVGDQWDVVVGGLGLGHTAHAALDFPALRSLLVIEALPEVIGWHRDGLVPLGPTLTADTRCRMLVADFFARVHSAGLDPEHPTRRFHAILLDIDHSPQHLLHPSHGGFYEEPGLQQLAAHLHPGGVFALWADGPPDENFLAALKSVFAEARAEVVKFFNPIQDCESSSTVYLARRSTDPSPPHGAA